MDIIDGETGEVVSPEEVAYAYTREGRKVIGKEYPNPTPMEPPIGYIPSRPLHEQIREMVLREISEAADRADSDTEEEANDFDVGDDFDPTSPYEIGFEPTAPWPETVAEAAGQAGPAEPAPQAGPSPASSEPATKAP